ncbi:MAG TPA: hypothetical protein VLT90_11175 [Terriglobales bacterium]|nr:hypothetical protein [Terriglobales bacterium]
MLNTKRISVVTGLAILLPILLAGSALAEPATGQRVHVAKQLSELKEAAWEMRKEAARLDAMTPNRQLSWESHIYRLGSLKDQVNQMGKMLAQLESQRGIAAEEQALAIDHARLHLVPVAENVTAAIEMVNENRHSVYWGDYSEAVSGIEAHARELHSKLDTVVNYDSARIRLDQLELQPITAGGE